MTDEEFHQAATAHRLHLDETAKLYAQWFDAVMASDMTRPEKDLAVREAYKNFCIARRAVHVAFPSPYGDYPS